MYTKAPSIIANTVRTTKKIMSKGQLVCTIGVHIKMSRVVKRGSRTLFCTNTRVLLVMVALKCMVSLSADSDWEENSKLIFASSSDLFKRFEGCCSNLVTAWRIVEKKSRGQLPTVFSEWSVVAHLTKIT